LNRLVVISNRVGSPDAINAGGLATAMLNTLRENGGLWLGWSGDITLAESGSVRFKQDGEVQFATFDLTQNEHDSYYAGFSNRSLWPLFHYRPDLVDFQRDAYSGYHTVNELFAQHALELLRPGDMIWIHDYHLIPLAACLRKQGVRNRIGFFLHTPLAPPELLRTLPCHEELFSTFQAYDLIGVQTENDLRALQDYFKQTLNAKLQPGNWIRLPNGRTFQADAFPISIDTNTIARQARSAIMLPAIDRLYDSLSGRALMIGVDRLDYSKGLPARFEAFGRLLERNSNFHSRVTMLQIAPPTRSSVPEYQNIRAELERVAGHINGLYAAPDWIPIRYVNRSFPQKLLAGYYRTAQIALVTPLRDGMNLVAKEYVACQNPENPGVLVLSRFAGAAHELEAALQVNPFDQDEIADAMARALSMSLSERRVRWNVMMEQLRTHDITAWRESFLQRLEERKLLTMRTAAH
jgi:trehalose 6-phosphate synthase